MTTAIAIEALIDSILNDEYVTIMVSPSQRQSDRLMWYVHKAFMKLQKQMGEKIKLLTHKRDGMVFTHGSELWSLPNSPATVMGFDANRVVMDEAGIFPTREGIQMYEAVMGCLAAKGGGISLSGMPYGRGKFFYEKYEDATLKKNDFSIHRIPWTDRARQDKVYKDTVEEQSKYLSSIQFSQTYECEFIDENIVMFPYDLLESCVDDTIRLISGDMPYGCDVPIFLGVDFAKKIDKTSIIGVAKLDTKTQGPRYKVFLIKNSKDSYDQQLKLIEKLDKNLRPQAIFVDESGPGVPMADFLKRTMGSKIRPIAMTQQAKERLMLDLRNLMADKRLLLPDHRNLIDELHSIEKSVTDLGNVRYVAPRDEGGHADMAFALALSVNQMDQHDFNFTII